MHFTKTDKFTHLERAALSKIMPSSALCILSTLEGIIAESDSACGGVSIPVKVLSGITGYSMKTVNQSLKKLSEYGFIGIGKYGRNNLYILNPDLLSTSKGEHITYTSIDGVRVIVDTKEANHFKSSVRKLIALRKELKVLKNLSGLNSRSVKSGNNYKIENGKEKKGYDVDKSTGEIKDRK